MPGETIEAGLLVTAQGVRESQAQMAGLTQSVQALTAATIRESSAATQATTAQRGYNASLSQGNAVLLNRSSAMRGLGAVGRLGSLAAGAGLLAGMVPEEAAGGAGGDITRIFGGISSGFFLGSTFGPIGAGIGAAAGGLLGAASALTRAAEKTEQASSKLQEEAAERTERQKREREEEERFRLERRLAMVDELVHRRRFEALRSF